MQPTPSSQLDNLHTHDTTDKNNDVLVMGRTQAEGGIERKSSRLSAAVSGKWG